MIVSLLLFSVTEALFSASPGPAVVMVVSATMSGGRRAAKAVVFGVLLGNLIYFVISCALFLGATRYNDQLFLYIKLAGAAYLVYLLFDRYFGSSRHKTDDTVNLPTHGAQKSLFFGGLAMQLANPKTILFFSAFLPQFINTNYNIPMQFAIMAGLSWSIEYTILAAYARGTQLLMHRFSHWSSRLEHLGNVTMMAAVVWGLWGL